MEKTKKDYITNTYMEVGMMLGADLFGCYLVNKIDDVNAQLESDPYNAQLHLAKNLLEEIHEAYYVLAPRKKVAVNAK